MHVCFQFVGFIFQEFRQFLCLCEDSEETEVSEEIERLYKAIDADDSSSSSDEKQGAKPKANKDKKKVKKVWVVSGENLSGFAFFVFAYSTNILIAQ